MEAGRNVGRPVRRLEDARFLTGAGCFTEDLALPGQVHAVVVRSPHPHARIRGIDAAAAKAGAGVLAVLTAEDIAAEVPGSIPSFVATPPFAIVDRRGTPVPDASQSPLARERVRYLGEPVALVVAETLAAARDAAEAVAVDYEPLPALVDLDSARRDGAPRIWDDAPGNGSFEWETGDRAAVDGAFARASRVVRRVLVNNRVCPVFLEPRAAMADYDPEARRYTLRAGGQSAHRVRAILAGMLGIEPERLRVIVPDTGGGFGARGVVYPELALVLVAARRTGRPVRWVAERGESFLSDTQARDQVITGELALDDDGHFLALRARVDWRHGAYLPSRSVWVMVHFLPATLGGVYRIPAGHVEILGTFTNTTPQTAYRGVGRMEASYLVESLVDAAARELGVDPVDLRRRNLIGAADLPWRTAGGGEYGSGEFARVLDLALRRADHAGFAARRRESEARGRRRGLGVAMCVENDGGAPSEYAEVEALADGRVSLRIGTQSFGMGHETLYAQILADAVELPMERIEVVFGDTERVLDGFGSHGSRSARIGGGAAVYGTRAMLGEARRIAAGMLEAAEADLEYAAGRFAIGGTDRGESLAEIAAFAGTRGERVAGESRFEPGREAHSNACQVSEVEVDPETGAVRLVRHTVVADVGLALNPMIVEGQIHGGAAQGIGQALLEQVVYDAETGQTLTGTFMDYAIPRADDLPALRIGLHELAEPDNPLGVKGAGEVATSGAPAALMNALRDALGEAADTLDMPATPERVWRALRGSAGSGAATRLRGPRRV